MPKDPPPLTERFLAAVALAEELHGRDRRSGTEIPYLAHLLVVTGLVIEDGGDEDEAIAALLHDAVEDGGGRVLLDRITRSFGPHVADIVERLSDSVEVDPQEPWIERKPPTLLDATLRPPQSCGLRTPAKACEASSQPRRVAHAPARTVRSNPARS